LDPLGVTQVDHGHPTLLVHHEVGSLHVAVDKPAAVQIPQDQTDLDREDFGELGVQTAHHLQQFV
jgi:hypothetical protein